MTRLLGAVIAALPLSSIAMAQTPGRPALVWASNAFLDDTVLPSGGQRGLNGKGAIIGASVGLVIGGAVGAVLDNRNLSTHGPLLPKTATGGAIFGGLLGAGGGAAWKGAGLGLLVGVGVGAVIAASNSEAGLAPLVLGGAGAAAGVVIGALNRMTSQRDDTQEASQDRVHVSVAPYGSGVTVGASIAF
jgi:hypothetical protein